MQGYLANQPLPVEKITGLLAKAKKSGYFFTRD